MNERSLVVLRRFISRYVISYIKTHRCMVCFQMSRTVYHYCMRSFLMCSSCFDTIVYKCPQCRREHQIVNQQKAEILLQTQYWLIHVNSLSLKRRSTVHLACNIQEEHFRIDDQKKRCYKIIDAVLTKELQSIRGW